MRSYLMSFLILQFPFFALAQASGGNPSILIQLTPFLVMMGIFYFLIIRPQKAKADKHQNFISTLKKGDRVLTNSGIFGTVEGLNEKFVTLEIANGVKIRLLKSFVAQPIPEGNS